MRDANPYIPSDVENPSMAQTRQKHIKVLLKNYKKIMYTVFPPLIVTAFIK